MKQKVKMSICASFIVTMLLSVLYACAPLQPSSVDSSGSLSDLSSSSLSQGASSASPTLPVKGGPGQLLFSGAGRCALETADRYYVISYAEKEGSNCIISCFDKDLTRLWEYPAGNLNFGFEDNQSLHILSNGLVAYRTSSAEGNFLTAINEKGMTEWITPLKVSDARSVGITANAYGGMYLFYQYYDASKNLFVLTVSEDGRISGPKPLLGMERYDDVIKVTVSMQQAVLGSDGDVYIHGACSRIIDEYNTEMQQYIALYDKDLNIREVFFSKDEQYGSINMDYINRRMFFHGQDYGHIATSQDKMRGMFYELDFNCNILSQKEYAKGQPYYAAMLDSGALLVSVFNDDDLLNMTVHVYDARRNFARSFDSGVGWAEIYPAADGGFLLKGNILAQGESYNTLFLGSVRARLDTVVIKYSADFELEWQNRYPVAEGKSGYDYFVYIDGERNILTE